MWCSGLACPTAAWLSGFIRHESTVVSSVPLSRCRSPAMRAQNWPSSARRSVSSGARRIFSGRRQRTLQRSSFRRGVSPDRNAGRPFPVAWLCKQLGVARSGFYAWHQRLQISGCRAQENAARMDQVQAVFEQHRGFYASQRVHQELRATGLKLGRHRVARLVRTAGLKAKKTPRIQAMPQQRRQDRRNRGEPAAAGDQPCSPQSLLGR